MKKLIGMMLIAVNCTCNANADWLLLVSSDQPKFDLYVDASTKRREGNSVEMRYLYNLPQAMRHPIGNFSFKSYEGLDAYSCKGHSHMPRSLTFYSGGMAEGAVVFKQDINGVWNSVQPGTPIARLLQAACSN